MNYKPQTFTFQPWFAVLAGFAVLVSSFCMGTAAGIADEPEPKVEATADEAKTESPASDSGKTADAANEAPLPTADEILTQLRTKLEGLDSLKCELRQTALISGMKLTGFGRYLEASGNRVNLKYFIFPLTGQKQEDAAALALDATPPAVNEAENRGELTQVSDGTVLYTMWKNGETKNGDTKKTGDSAAGSASVTRRNIRDILEAAKATTSYDPKNATMDLGVGGLRGLISRLQTSMEFAPVKSVKVGDRQFFEVTGRWNAKIRNDVFKIPADTLVDPRPQVPEYVRVYIDAQTMLPRRIQYLKRSLDATQKMVRPMITLDFTNVVINEAVDDSMFAFQAPEGTKEEDGTQQVIQLIQQSVGATENPTGQPAASTDGSAAPSGEK